MGVVYVFFMCKTVFSYHISIDILYLILYVAQCFIFGSSLRYTVTYLYLNYLGFTMKELIAIREHTNRKAICINPLSGMRNLFGFYLDFEPIQSEFSKEYAR